MKSIEQLKEALQQELNMYQQVLEMAKEKTQIIKQGRLKELEENTSKEQQYIRTMGTFEKIRRSIFTNISQELEIQEPSSVSELLLHLEEEEASHIDDIRNQLLEVIHRLEEINKLNEKLIYQSLEYVNFNIELMTTSHETSSHYGEKEAGNRKTVASLLDIKV
ncbi:flagellar protein FlgN [Natronincola ferrireducens]|uniref:FlgN protein n=1 Tax=Natronincola ferrireducens TaxID=393762 RepID=A0A1G8XKT7_9FIRM|nr:flagellar protein FlgN [Natronincola ferrireducens]SDJ91063.1 FlgN protein [Natronincola ferrireducens]